MKSDSPFLLKPGDGLMGSLTVGMLTIRFFTATCSDHKVPVVGSSVGRHTRDAQALTRRGARTSPRDPTSPRRTRRDGAPAAPERVAPRRTVPLGRGQVPETVPGERRPTPDLLGTLGWLSPSPQARGRTDPAARRGCGRGASRREPHRNRPQLGQIRRRRPRRRPSQRSESRWGRNLLIISIA